MDLSGLLDQLRAAAAYRSLVDDLKSRSPVQGSLRLLRSARAPLAAALAIDLQRPIVLVVPRPDRLMVLAEELPAWTPDARIYPFPDPNPLFYERAAWGPRTLRQRVVALTALTEAAQPGAGPAGGAPQIIIAPARALMTRTLARRDFLANSRTLRVRDALRPDRLLDLLVGTGYTPDSLVTEPGQFSRRGGILDLWPPAEALPVRVELFGDEIDSLRQFDPATQRSTDPLDEVRLSPAREGLPRMHQEAWDAWLPATAEDPQVERQRLREFFLPWANPGSAGLLDFLPNEAILLMDDRLSVEDAATELEEQAVALRGEQESRGELPADAPLPYVTLTELREALEDRTVLDLGMLAGEAEMGWDVDEAFSPGPRFGGQLRAVLDHLEEQRRAHTITVVVSRQAPRLAELWSEAGSPQLVLERLPAELAAGDLHFVQGALSEGWRLEPAEGAQIHLLTDAEVFGWSRPQPRQRPTRRAASPEAFYSDLAPGDWVVHIDYGIGRFAGLVERTLDDLTREFLLVEFADGDQLFVPVHQADRVTRYIGVDASPPSASRLGSQEWERTRTRAQEAVAEVARDLLDLYARRMAVEGHAFPPDGTWQRELEASFAYLETEDQLQAIRAVKVDMERARPMDRLVCGDVGYGKTEVALRAAFKAVMDGRQVAMLVPTTVLAQQHFNTFRQRLAAFPVEVDMLSRFRTRAEADRILERLEGGEVDILIGTHRLLQKDVRFKDLGLLVIDEEQRFGVTDKESLKRLRTEVDVLTMTATPIPRTLYLALTGARDISTINTPPEERLPIVTHIGPYDPRLVRQAVLREMDRGGQVFFVHNRVQTIEAMHARLERLIPEARLAVAHGQMPEKDLAGVMERFTSGEVDVLLSTSIIESGLDIPNANTLIVDRADTFGLAQLYQLRGRVGRSAARAYAYFFRHPHFRSTEEARERLEILAEHTQLGAGYSIAMRDLEMRGAGDVLGVRQHGHIAAIGFHLYTRMLAAAVRRLKAGREAVGPEPGAALTTPDPLMVTIELPLAYAIPASYVPDRDLRLHLYRRLADFRSEEEVETLRSELQDRFGPIPEEVENLVYQMRVRIRAAHAGVEAITAENGQLLLQVTAGEEDAEEPNLGADVRRSRRGYWLARREGWRQRLLDVLVALQS
jgi:transcription-repair coupling factor (superfamily II helicase)